jgi:hypothetical protein
MRIKPAVTKTWIDDVLMKVDDRKFDMKALNAKIKPIVWKDFGPLKKSVNIGIDEKRKFLFENLEFFVFDRDQVKREGVKIINASPLISHHFQSMMKYTQLSN